MLGWLRAGMLTARAIPVAAAALALAIAALGEVGASQARELQRAATATEATELAQRAEALVDGRIRAFRVVGQAIAYDPSIRAGLATGDEALASPVLGDVGSRLGVGQQGPGTLGGAGSFAAWYLVDREGVPFGPHLRAGRFPVDRATIEQLRRSAGLNYSVTTVRTKRVGAVVGEAPTVVLFSTVPGAFEPFLGAFVLEIAANRVFDNLAPHVNVRSDIYVLEGGILIGRARDAFDHRAVDGLDATRTLPVDTLDPLAGGRRILAARPVSNTDWHVIASMDPSAAEAQLSESLAWERAIRIVLLGLLLVGAVALSRALETLARQRARLSGSLEQQTAIGEVLKAINRTALDLPAVLETVVSAAGRLCDADVGWLNQSDEHVGEVPGVRTDGVQFEGRWSRVGAYYARTDELRDQAYRAFTRVKPIGGLFPMYRETVTSLAILDRTVVNVPDWTAESRLRASGFARAMNVRALLAVPLIREGEAIGAIALGRLDQRVFSDREVALAQTFADQAAIAIENVRLFNEIQDKSRQLEVASRHKSEFLANMSHELRTPLNAVIGFSEVLESGMTGELSDKQREYVRDIASSGKHLLDLVNEILDLSKVEAGRMDLERSEFSAADAILSTFAFVRERAARHGIELAADVPADLGTLVADERKVRQVLLNLLSNAVKFTPDGGWIGVSARRENGELAVSVRDTGIGIAPEDQPNVFEEFRQVGKASDRSREGTGLGLTLAKRFVELHGGRIWFESELGSGTTFTFALPVGSEVSATA